MDAWLVEYAKPTTQRRYRISLTRVIEGTGATQPADLDAAALAAWAQTQQCASNTMRGHIAAVRTFLRWCTETGVIDGYRDAPMKRLLRSFPAVLGKQEGIYPANRLDAQQYERLLTACNTGNEVGLRDEAIIRLAVAGGMRASEVMRLTVGSLDALPRLSWVGKANKRRSCEVGPSAVALLERYLDAYAHGIGNTPAPGDPLFCVAHHRRGFVRWGTAITTIAALTDILVRRSTLAGLGRVTCHDLKRTAARMMHEARSADGGHLFDLLDIADVLDHANPAVTQHCYIGPLGNANKARAAELFD